MTIDLFQDPHIKSDILANEVHKVEDLCVAAGILGLGAPGPEGHDAAELALHDEGAAVVPVAGVLAGGRGAEGGITVDSVGLHAF